MSKKLKAKLNRVNWVLVLYFQGIIALLIWLAISLCGCSVSNYRHTYPGGQEVFVWQGSLLYPSVYKQFDGNLPDNASLTFGYLERKPDPNSIKAVGSAGGEVIGTGL